MKAAVLWVCLLSLTLSGLASAQTPTITAVVDAISAGTRLAPGSLATVFGTSLGTDKSVAVTVAGKKAYVFFASDGQFNIQIPVDAPVGPTTITIGASAPMSITLSQYAPVLVTTAGLAAGLAASHSDGTLVTAASPAQPGEAITVVAIGLGATKPQVPTGTATPQSIFPTDPAQATVTVAGQPATVSFSGLEPGAIGIYQVNLTVPKGIPGGNQAITLSIGGVSSQSGTILPVAGAPGPLIRPGPDGVLSAGTYFPQGAPGSGIAQGSYFVVKGSGLGPASIVLAAPPFTTSVGGANGTSITVTPSGGSPVQAFMYYALDVQVAGILPSNTPVGPATVTVTYNGVASPPAKMTVVKSAFGMYTLNQGGSGPALLQNVSSDGKSAPLNALTNAAAPGQFLVLYGTGLGPVSTSDSDAPGQVVPVEISVQVLAGNKAITPIYAGRQPQFPGLDQIVFQLPSDDSVPDGCFVPLAVVVNGVSSNYGTFAKATGSSTCPAPLGLTASMLARLDQGGTLTGGIITLTKFTAEASAAGLAVDTSTERAFVSFTSLDASGLFELAQTAGAAGAVHPPGTCVMGTADVSFVLTSTISPGLKQPNAGSPLTLAGPNGKTASLPYDAIKGYSATLATSTPLSTAAFIEAGAWSMKAPGGTDIGSFTANITVPAPLDCTNCGAIATIDRTKPLTINWTGGGGSQDSVHIGGTSMAPSTADPTQSIAVAFSCAARASDGTLTVPVSILSQMPPSSNDPNAAAIGALTLVNVLGAANTFTAPLAAGGSLDFGLFNYSSLFSKIVGYN